MVMVNLREIKKDQIDFIVIVDLFFKSNSFRYYEGYIDELWDRIGLKLKKRRVTESDIDEVIQQIRAEEC